MTTSLRTLMPWCLTRLLGALVAGAVFLAAAVPLQAQTSPPAPTVQFEMGGYSVAENAGTVKITIVLSSASSQPVTVDYASSDGTATAGQDYTAVRGTVTFGPGETSKSFLVTILDDFIAELDETFTLTLSNPNPKTIALGQRSTATVLILDDDGGPPTVQFSQAEYEFSESDGTVSLTVTLSPPTDRDVTVNYQITGGTATAGADYSAPSSGTLTFPAGQTEQSIQVTIVDDTVPEDTESVQFQLFNPANAAAGAVMAAILYIVDDDGPLPTVQFGKTVYPVAEVAGTANVKVTLSKASAGPVTVTCKSYDGDATAPDRYGTVNKKVEFAAGQTEKIVAVSLVNDDVFQPIQSFTLTLSNPSKGAVLGTPATTTVTILDDDVPPYAMAVIQPADKQRGVTGDLVASTKGDKGLKHYVSPKQAASYVILKGVPQTAGVTFQDSFVWDGGEAGDTPDTRKVSRAASGQTLVKIKVKANNNVVDQMSVWVVWATFEPTKVVTTIASGTKLGTPPGRVKDTWRIPKATWFRFLATIAPKSIIDGSATAGDIPKLDGANTQNVPGPASLAKGADMRWDVSRRTRLKILNPAPTTLVRNDYWDAVEADLDAVAKSFPAASVTVLDYPADTLVGNDDDETTAQDNNPYSNAEEMPPRSGLKSGIGQVASDDVPRSLSEN